MFGIVGLASQGASVQETKLDVISNNLANVNTPGYKKDRLIFKSFSSVLDEIGKGRPFGVGIAGTSCDFSQGPLRATANKLDVAIAGKGFFAVDTPNGRMYTRSGRFSINESGILCDSNGNQVVGAEGPISINGTHVEFASDGSIFVDGKKAGRLLVTDFPKPYALKKAGDGMYTSDMEGFSASNFSIKQGFLEDSSVEAVEEMANMIESHRVFEANENVVRVVDDLLGRLISEVPRL